MHANILRVTRAIEVRSKDLRDDYLSDVDAMRLGAPDATGRQAPEVIEGADYIEEADGVLHVFEFKWNTNAKFKLPKTFSETYKDYKAQLITSGNFHHCYPNTHYGEP